MASMRRQETNAMRLERHLDQLLKRQDTLKSSVSEKQNRSQELEAAMKVLQESRRKLNEDLQEVTRDLLKVDAEIETIEDALKAAHVVDAELARLDGIDGSRITPLEQERSNNRANESSSDSISGRPRGRKRMSDTASSKGKAPARDNGRVIHSDPIWAHEIDDQSDDDDPLDAFRVSPSPPPRKKPKTEPREIRHSVYRPL
ncbi:hypothetical protein CALCODRAFT_496402 [Calocera cornea HHB12733]|uniref:Uncharacterized protein n=1 Tax=Calocera cornea HHB12733 TaxID=1353952 RepID=A0A165FVX7_9BASI|nr:hypothetical protein CALCODRAFT_496402 [Calocera cornea HHB12733]